ncbi:MAG: class I SAM-dependent methyltransferase [Accumulibacter sp.]|jgi:2-polyprenyl-3-methyl-5-hydroxy-6-metoxy-1,4-benzoquinol methylase|uniref:class I SAM-dependent methyltransferase n=1 Tax=Accumulibacter sp. TaxID=2053492 RepID=UPI002FC2BEC1
MPATNALDQHVRAYQGDNIYDFDNEILLKWYPTRVLKFSENAASLLELGLGHGIAARVFGKHFGRHVIVDASPAVIANFNQKYSDSDAEIVESYFETFESKERFDIIVFGFVLEHVDDPVQVLEHFGQFLNPRGRMFVTVPNAEVLNRRLGHLAGMLSDMQELSHHDRLLGHKRYYTVQTLRRDIERAGYEIKRLEGLYLKPLSTRQMLMHDFDDRVIEAFCTVGIDYPELSCGLLAELALRPSSAA